MKLKHMRDVQCFFFAKYQLSRSLTNCFVSSLVNVVHCLMNLIEVIPSCVKIMVGAGLITTTANVIEQAMGYQDIADVCAKILNRVALEHPVEVMKCPAIGMLTQMSDFFEKMT